MAGNENTEKKKLAQILNFSCRLFTSGPCFYRYIEDFLYYQRIQPTVKQGGGGGGRVTPRIHWCKCAVPPCPISDQECHFTYSFSDLLWYFITLDGSFNFSFSSLFDIDKNLFSDALSSTLETIPQTQTRRQTLPL